MSRRSGCHPQVTDAISSTYQYIPVGTVGHQGYIHACMWHNCLPGKVSSPSIVEGLQTLPSKQLMCFWVPDSGASHSLNA
jgi:hypothetical protein